MQRKPVSVFSSTAQPLGAAAPRFLSIITRNTHSPACGRFSSSFLSSLFFSTLCSTRTHTTTASPLPHPSRAISTPCRFFSSACGTGFPLIPPEGLAGEGRGSVESHHTSTLHSPSITTTTKTSATSSTSSCPISRSLGTGNFFAFFGFTEDPEIDETELQRRYHAFQKNVHPDQRQQEEAERVGSTPVPHVGTLLAKSGFSQLGLEPRAAAMDAISTYANEGYSLLKDPFLRCRYLCKLQQAREEKRKNATNADDAGKLSVEEEELLVLDADNVIRDSSIAQMDEEFLMEMMQINELIFAGDAQDEMVRNQMIILKADLEERSVEMFDLAKSYWREQSWDDLMSCIHKWTYIWNARNNLVNRM